MIVQNILEKFEFFPIKCRVQRSLEIFQKAQEQTAMHKGRQFTQKVSGRPPVPAIPEAVVSALADSFCYLPTAEQFVTGVKN